MYIYIYIHIIKYINIYIYIYMYMCNKKKHKFHRLQGQHPLGAAHGEAAQADEPRQARDEDCAIRAI